MHSDDDAVTKDYFSNLNKFYKENPDSMYSYSHIVPFDPYTQVPCDTLKIYNKNKHFDTIAPWRLNHTKPINRFCNVDSTQVSWRIQCNKQHNIWLPEDSTKKFRCDFLSWLT